MAQWGQGQQQGFQYPMQTGFQPANPQFQQNPQFQPQNPQFQQQQNPSSNNNPSSSPAALDLLMLSPSRLDSLANVLRASNSPSRQASPVVLASFSPREPGSLAVTSSR